MPRLLICALLVSGCGRPLDDLRPFPCAEDLGCPAGTFCLQGKCDEFLGCAPGLPSSCAANGARSRCALVGAPSTSGGVLELLPDCAEPSPAPIALGQQCTLPVASREHLEPDDCAAGSACADLDVTGQASPAGSAVCRAFCSADKDCASGEVCGALVPGAVFGLCASANCQPGSQGGSGCASGAHCELLPLLGRTDLAGTCHADGAAAEGASCAGASCSAGLVCVPESVKAAPLTCRKLCAAQSGCPSGQRCDLGAAIIAGGALGICH